MELSDIAIVAFAILSAIISAITKNNAKKKAEAARSAQLPREPLIQEKDEFTAEYWEEVRPAVVLQHVGKEPYVSEIERRESWSYDQQAIAESESATPVDDTRRLKPKRVAQDVEENIYALNKSKSEEREGHAFMKNISLTDIIIYSELLKPKFQEY